MVARWWRIGSAHHRREVAGVGNRPADGRTVTFAVTLTLGRQTLVLAAIEPDAVYLRFRWSMVDEVAFSGPRFIRLTHATICSDTW